MQKGWHTYWQNPGDSGLPTTLEWKLPAGVSAGPIEWPAPHALPAGPLVNYGYDGEVLHLVQLTPQRALATGAPAVLRARADWLVCKEVCIPEGADLELALPVDKTAAPDPRWGAPIAAARAALPRPLEGWKTTAEGKGATIDVKLVPPAGAGDPGASAVLLVCRIAGSSPRRRRRTRREGDAYVLTLPVSYNLAGNPGRLAGVLTAANGLSPTARAATIDVPIAGAVRAGAKPALRRGARAQPRTRRAADERIVARACDCVRVRRRDRAQSDAVRVSGAVAQGAGLRHAPRRKATLRKEAFAFAAGVVVTFVALGLVLAALRAAGEQLGWGFQLQSPAVVTALAALFFVIALNLSGVFEFGQIAPSGIAEFTAKNRTVDALRLRRPRGAHRIALHGAVHGRGAGLRDLADRRSSRSSSSSRSASAWRSPTSRSRCCPAGGGSFRARARGCCASSRCSRFRCTRR